MGGMGLYNDFRAVMGFRTTSKTFLKKKNKKKNSSEMKTKAILFSPLLAEKDLRNIVFFFDCLTFI